MGKHSGLGKGLDALFLDNNTFNTGITYLKISDVEPNRDQPRRTFDEKSMNELAESIKKHGIIQPIVVRQIENSAYQIVAGERRWRAARIAGLSEVPVVVREINDEQALEIAIIENLQREDLNAIELGQGYLRLMGEHGMTQEEIADALGKSRPVIANTIRLLSLPESVQNYVRGGEISRSYAKALLSLENTELIENIAGQVVRGEILVRDIEKLAREQKKTSAKDVSIAVNPAEVGAWGDNYYKEVELALSTELGRKVRIFKQGNKSIFEMEIYNMEELADLAARLTRS